MIVFSTFESVLCLCRQKCRKHVVLVAIIMGLADLNCYVAFGLWYLSHLSCSLALGHEIMNNSGEYSYERWMSLCSSMFTGPTIFSPLNFSFECWFTSNTPDLIHLHSFHPPQSLSCAFFYKCKALIFLCAHIKWPSQRSYSVQQSAVYYHSDYLSQMESVILAGNT